MKVTMNLTNPSENDEYFSFPNQPQSNPLNTMPKPPTNLKQTIGVSVLTCVITAALVGVIGFAIGTRYQNFYRVINKNGGSLDYSELDAVYAQLQQNYDGVIDKDKLIKGAAAGMAAAVGDPYTNYFTEDEAKSFLNDLSGQFEGIGAELGTNKDGQLEIVAPLDDSPAKKAGLQPRDIIVAIDGKNSITMSPTEAITHIRGKSGTVVKLTIMRGSETKEVPITRATISNPSVKWEIINNIGYIRISQFGDDTTDLARKAAQELKDKKVKGIVLDLRGNGGGYVDVAKNVASLWLSSGTVIVQEKSGDKVIGVEKASGNSILKGIKTIVLVDGGTASASEIVAGALRDHKVATLVGTKTYGKGVVQQMFQLDSGAEVKITIAKWYTQNGSNIDQTGLDPDIKVEITAEQHAAGNDTQLQRALDILK